MSPRWWTALILVGLTAGFRGQPALSGSETIESSRHTSSIPLDLAHYRGEDLEITERQLQLLESRDVLLREYSHTERGEAVLACVAVAEGQRRVAHPPEVCYRGQGWSIEQMETCRRTLAGRGQSVQRLHIAQHGEERLVYSWYRVGPRQSPSYLRQQIWGVWSRFQGKNELSALVRFSTAAAGDPARAEAVLERFCDEFLPELEKALQSGSP
jgi:EpsI family protein